MRAFRRFEQELARMGRLLQELRLGPIAPGEVRCVFPHGVEGRRLDGPEIRATGAAVLGCPGCGARL